MKAKTGTTTGLMSWVQRLHKIQIGKPKSARIRHGDLVRLLQCLSTLVSNGVSLSSSLDSIQSDPSFSRYRVVLRSLCQAVNSGGSLSAGMKRFPTVFSALLVHQIEVGETTGKLGDAVRRIVSQLENRSQLRSFLLKKLTYPCVLLSAGFCCVVFMLTNVIPTFQAMYKESGAVLPSITQFLVDLSSLCTQHGILVLLSMASAGLAIAAALANSTSRHAIDGWLLKVPLLGNWLRNVSILQFTETLGNLLESGIQLTDALPAAAKTVTNRYARERLLGLHAAIRRGEKLSSAMSSSQDHLFPPVVRQLVIVGEKSGKLAEVTRQIHTHLKADVEKHTAIMLAAIEPLITALLASVIGTILLAVYLPMFDMLSNQPH